MKRSWLGFGLLLLLLIAGLLTSAHMEKCHMPIAHELELAAQAAQTGDWNQARTLAEQASSQWQRCWQLSAALADHEPMEDIDGMFAQLEIYLLAGNAESTAAVCRELASRVEDMADAHDLKWWNLL